MSEVSTPEKIGEQNKKLILDYVRKYGPVSRADIKRSLGMSFPSVSANVKDLLDMKYLLEGGEGDNSLGRKSTLLVFNATRGYVIGVDLGRSQIRIIVADLEGREIVSLKDESTIVKEGRKITERLTELVCETVKRAQIQAEKVKCICIGVPGVIDERSDEVLIAPFIQPINWKKLTTALNKYFEVPVLIENSVNYGAIGEKWRGAAKGYKDIVYINYGVGVGAAIIINGELHRGINGASGEIGFMVPERVNLRSAFSEQGVLEAIISGNQLNEIMGIEGIDTNIETVIRQSAKGEKASELLVREIVEYIGMMLINITSVFNEELIVIGGGLGDYLGGLFIPEWKKMLNNHVPFVPEVVTSKLHSHANVLGAVAAGLRHINEYIKED